MPRKQLASVISWFSYLGIKDISQCLQEDSTLIKQWSSWLSVYSYKAILLSVMLHMIICHVLFNYVMIVLSWPFHLVPVLLQGLFLLITLMTRAAHTTSSHKQTAGPVMIHLCILKDKRKNKDLFRAHEYTLWATLQIKLFINQIRREKLCGSDKKTKAPAVWL